MKNLLKILEARNSCIGRLKLWEERVRYDYIFFKSCEDYKYPYGIFFIECLWFSFIQLFARVICKYKGHDIVDTSYGGPGSGCISAYCKRCGEDWHTQLY